jgi:hypothetical protein
MVDRQLTGRQIDGHLTRDNSAPDSESFGDLIAHVLTTEQSV